MGLEKKQQVASIVEIEEILEIIPHRYPFLLIDRVKDIVLDKSATGIKNVTINESFFQGHFPGKPTMPGVLIIESMAQTAAVLVVIGLIDAVKDKVVYFMSIESARFRKPVTPGDTMNINVTTKQVRGNVWKFSGEAFVEDTIVAEANFTAMIVDR